MKKSEESQIRAFVADRGYNISLIRKETKLGQNTLYRWLRGESLNESSLKLISDFAKKRGFCVKKTT